MFKIIQLALVLLLTQFAEPADIIDNDLVITDLDRSIDITTQVVKYTSKITLQNKGKNAASFFLFSVEPEVKSHVCFLSSSTTDGKNALNVVTTKVQGHDDKVFWRINLRDNLQPGKKIVVEVEAFLTKILKPFPATITQKDTQLVIFQGNAHVYSPYTVIKQTTTINYGGKKVESYTKIKPASQNDKSIVYGPFENVAPFSIDPVSIHYENNSPFLTVTSLERVLEVSHWGNIAVEETVSIEHKGAALKGSFSRYDFQRDMGSGQASVKSFKTVLHPAAKDVYYRDEIGNISTSHLRPLSDSIELDIRPRFPLFGGWKTKYTIGYNIPSYEYLFNSGDRFVLKMPILDHIFDDMVVEQLTTKIILPEGSKNIKLKTPYPVVRLPDEKHYTYLDTIGRPVIKLESKNLLENHIQDFELSYTYPTLLMFQEPLLAVIAFFVLFLVGIIYVRLDLSISKSSSSKKDN